MVTFDLPYLHGDKTSILLDAIESTHTLELDFDTVLANTITSYNPDQLGEVQEKADQISNGSCFSSIGRRDPIAYQDTWENVLEHALMVESKFKGGNILNHEERIASLSEMAYMSHTKWYGAPFTGILNKEYRKAIIFACL